MIQAKRVLPLALLHYAEGNKIEGRTRFQKLAFLADQRLEGKGIDPFDFYPYDYGPFDEGLYEALEWLEDEGLVSSSEKPTYGGDIRYDYSLTEKGKKSIQKNVPESKDEEGLTDDEVDVRTMFDVAEKVITEYNHLPISNLIKKVYEEHPDYTEESVLN